MTIQGINIRTNEIFTDGPRVIKRCKKSNICDFCYFDGRNNIKINYCMKCYYDTNRIYFTYKLIIL